MSASLPDIDQRRKDTPAERAARGKDARKRAPRSVHAAWEPRPDRADPVALLEEQAAERAQELVPIRYGRMLVSPGTFYRGGALLMASDLAGTPGSGLQAQLCGDAHLLNFGLFQSPERRLVFDINDFDETLPGPWEWDVKRLVATGWQDICTSFHREHPETLRGCLESDLEINKRLVQGLDAYRALCLSLQQRPLGRGVSAGRRRRTSGQRLHRAVLLRG